MNFTSIGDVSQSLVTKRRNTALKLEVQRLTQELSSGRTSDVSHHLSGRLSQLGDVEHQIVSRQAQGVAAKETGILAASMQNALSVVESGALDVASRVVGLGATTGDAQLVDLGGFARGALEDVISALNSQVAGRSLFAGADVGAQAISGATELLDAARMATSGVTDAAGFDAALDAFFALGGTFETTLYTGAATDTSPVALGSGQSVQLGIRADDAAIRSVLRDLLTVNLAGDTGLALDTDSRAALSLAAGERLFEGSAAITRVRADLGFAQSRIEDASVRIGAELNSLTIARNDLVSVDPFSTAAELETAQTQLETLYAVTARSARLNLMSFLS